MCFLSIEDDGESAKEYVKHGLFYGAIGLCIAHGSTDMIMEFPLRVGVEKTAGGER